MSALPQRRQRLLRIRFTGKRPTAEWLERGDFALALCAPLLVNRARRLGVAVLRGDQHPALGHSTRGRGQVLRAIARAQRGHRLGSGLDERGLRVAHCRRDTGYPLDLGLGKLLEVVGVLEGTIRHERGRIIRNLSLANRVLHNLAELVRITAIATERLQEHGNARLVCNNQRQHDLIEVRAMIATRALGDVHNLSLGLLVAVRL